MTQTTVPGQMDLLTQPEQRSHSEPEDYRKQKRQKDRLRVFMLGHGGHMTLAEIRQYCGGSDTGNSAALRRLRKEGYRLDTPRRESDGVWLYRLRAGEGGDWRKTKRNIVRDAATALITKAKQYGGFNGLFGQEMRNLASALELSESRRRAHRERGRV